PFRFEAGQFVEVCLPGVGEAPFTPSSSPSETERIDLTVMNVGRVTAALHALEVGHRLGLRGPLGKPYPLERFRGKEVLIVGGGVGLAPLRALLYALLGQKDRYARIVVRYGARTPADIVFRREIEEKWKREAGLDVLVSVDEGDESWGGPVGVVTTILEQEHLRCDPAGGVAVVCGPPVMMKFTTLKLLDLGYTPDRIFLSMEKNMSCGVGKCGHCRIGIYHACKDGPVFSFDQVKDYPDVWD
ncbi:MAG TPA: oxidoreductase, partial [Kiritimatiellae bacterium]|nr:oxidoreductase [Kiritimatiellia bacterium]